MDNINSAGNADPLGKLKRGVSGGAFLQWNGDLFLPLHPTVSTSLGSPLSSLHTRLSSLSIQHRTKLSNFCPNTVIKYELNKLSSSPGSNTFWL
jgi:hypothetical protein